MPDENGTQVLHLVQAKQVRAEVEGTVCQAVLGAWCVSPYCILTRFWVVIRAIPILQIIKLRGEFPLLGSGRAQSLSQFCLTGSVLSQKALSYSHLSAVASPMDIIKGTRNRNDIVREFATGLA